MKRVLFLLLLVPALGFAQNGQKTFSITGNISGLADGLVQIVTRTDDHTVIASDSSRHGVFTVKGSVVEPDLYFLVLSNEQPQYFFLDNSAIKITGDKNDIKNLKIEGSKSQSDFAEFNKTFNPLVAELNGFAALSQKETDEEKKAVYMKQFDSVVNLVNIETGKFIETKKSSFVSAFLLYQTAQLLSDPMLMEQRFNMLSDEVRGSQIGKTLESGIAYAKVGAVGTNALDFTQNDTSGKPVSLSSFKGKYVLLDFWASWCKPCRQENPSVLKAFNKFKDKNFTVLQVSLDQSKDAWLKAIASDKLSWNHVSDLQYWSNAAAQLYHINSIPGNFLIDPNGKIIAKDLRGEDLEKKLCELLGG